MPHPAYCQSHLPRVAAPARPGQGAAEHAQRAHLNVREQAVGGGNAGMGRPSVRR